MEIQEVQETSSLEADFPKFSESLDQTLNLLDKELKSHFEIGDILERFKDSYWQVRKIYKEGGKLGKYEFAACDLFDHDWHHVETDILMVAKILPAFLKEHLRQNYQAEDIENILYATLLHDIDYLRTKKEVAQGLYRWGGEKFFIHCQGSAQKAFNILQELLPQATEERRKKISELIRVTELNKMDGDEPELTEKDQTLGEVLYFADNLLSYFCDPNDIPVRVQGLYKEGQATARKACERTRYYFEINKVSIAKEFGLSIQETKTRFAQGRLTIADLRFPGQSVVEFVAGNYLPSKRQACERWLAYIDDWYGGREFNLERVFYEQNIERVRAIQVLSNTYKEEKGEASITCPPIVNPYCFIEAGLTGHDLREVYLRFQNDLIIKKDGTRVEIPLEYWDKVDLKLLGVPEGGARKDLFQRLVTRDIKMLLMWIKKEKRVEVLSYMIELFARKNILKREEGKERKDEIWLAIAPKAYAKKYPGEKDIMTAQEIFESFALANKRLASDENSANLPEIKGIWTVRREQDFENIHWRSYAQEIKDLHKEGLLGKVVFAGRENTLWIPFYREFITDLTNAGIKVVILAGQVMKEEGTFEMAQENIQEAARLALKTESRLVGLQVGLTPDLMTGELFETLKKLGQNGQLIFTPSSDMEIKDRLLVKIKDLTDHPMFKLILAGIPVYMADPHSFFPTSVEIEAIRVTTALFQSQVEAGEKKWTNFKFKDYVSKAQEFLQEIRG